MSDLKETILNRVNIAELIGQYVTLIQSGREYKACCPFHEEKTPSFYVMPEKNFYHCFGCKAGGNVIDFVMRQENLEFFPAMEWLANRHGIEIPRTEGQKREVGQKQRLLDLNEAAWKFYRRKLADPEGEVARQYIARRGIDPAVASEYGLGYAPKEWSALTDMLLAKGARASELESLGLIKPRTSGGGHYDAFRHRLIFPIHSVTGGNSGIIGFGGRALSDEDNPKYLNTSNTPLYEKSQVLYNLNRARGLAREEGIVVVEGYMDVIGLAQQGIANAVASCGTALTKEHVALLRRYSENIHLAFDGDSAGRNAAWSGGRLFLTQGIDARVLVIPGGLDPDDFVRERGAAAWKGLLSEARSVVQFWLEHQLATHPEADLARRRAWISELRPLWAAIRDELLREDIRRQVADQLLLKPELVGELLSGNTALRPRAGRGIDKERMARDNYRNLQRREHRTGLVEIRPGATEDLEDKVVRHRAGMVDNARNMASMQGSVPIEREVLRRLATDEEFRFIYLRLATTEWFALALHREIYAELSAAASVDNVIHDDRFRAFFAELLSRPPDSEETEAAQSLITRHNNMYLERRVLQLMAEIRQATQSGDAAREQQLLMKMIETKKQIRPVQGIGGGAQTA